MERRVNTMVLNLIAFKTGWLASVIGAANGLPLAGALTVAAVAALHLKLTRDRAGEAVLLLSAALIGFVWESLLVTFGVLTYLPSSGIDGIAPYWIVGMWVLFATTLNVGMRWLHKSLWVAAIAGAVGGPLSFVAGEKAGAVVFADSTISLLIIGAGWALLLPLLIFIAARYRAEPVAEAA